MSNHSGSYMLNDLIKLLERYEILENLGREKTQQLMRNILELGRENDCNSGEILEGIGERLGICYRCWKPAEEFEEGICKQCQEEWERRRAAWKTQQEEQA